MSAHLCVRVYANGQATYTIRDQKGVKSWLDHNRHYRPGNALFVDCKIVGPTDSGYLNEREVSLVEASLRESLADMGTLVPWKPAYDPGEGRAIYPEKGMRSFDFSAVRVPPAAEDLAPAQPAARMG